jgi:hypothetical protein
MDRGRYLHGPGHARQAIGPRLADQDLALDQSPDTLLQEERVPFRALDQHALERLQGTIVSEQGLEESFGAGGRQGIDPELGIIDIIGDSIYLTVC